jgi:hypothetical protein
MVPVLLSSRESRETPGPCKTLPRRGQGSIFSRGMVPFAARTDRGKESAAIGARPVLHGSCGPWRWVPWCLMPGGERSGHRQSGCFFGCTQTSNAGADHRAPVTCVKQIPDSVGLQPFAHVLQPALRPGDKRVPRWPRKSCGIQAILRARPVRPLQIWLGSAARQVSSLSVS